MDGMGYIANWVFLVIFPTFTEPDEPESLDETNESKARK